MIDKNKLITELDKLDYKLIKNIPLIYKRNDGGFDD